MGIFKKIEKKPSVTENFDDKSDSYFHDADYTGYGDSDVSFDDFINDSEPEEKTLLGVNIYSEFLNALQIDDKTIQKLLRHITKDESAEFQFLKANSDFTVIYFKDNSKHIVPITYNKLCQNLEALKAGEYKGFV